MNTAQRSRVRQSLITQGFRRTGCTDDLSGVGDYTETWTHPDGSTLDLTWAPREQPAGANKWQAALDRVLDRAEPVVSRPDDSSGSITQEVIEQVTADLREATVIYEQTDPRDLAIFEGRQVDITTLIEEGERKTLTGYPVDVWRFSPTALGIRVAFNLADPRHGDYAVLPDDAIWEVIATDIGTMYKHLPKVVN